MTVQLLDVFGDDLMVVNAARSSFAKHSDELSERDIKLIEYLASHRHTTPFRHPQLQFRVSVPIYVERQLFKHQIGMVASSISGRYVDFSDEYHKIQTFRRQSESSKQGSAGPLSDSRNNDALMWQDVAIEACMHAYRKLIELGVAKEQARTILPLNLMTQFIWTGSLLAFINLYNQRLAPDAQQETQQAAQMMLDAVKQTGKFTHSLKAHGYV